MAIMAKLFGKLVANSVKATEKPSFITSPRSLAEADPP